jgi:hypothetical protein
MQFTALSKLFKVRDSKRRTSLLSTSGQTTVSDDESIACTILIPLVGPTHFRTYEFLAWFIKKSLDQPTVQWILNYSVEYHGKSFCDTFFSLLSRVWKETTRFRDTLLLRLSDACLKLQEAFDGQVVAGVAVNGTPYKFNATFHPVDIIPHDCKMMDLAKHWNMFGSTLCYRFSVDLKASSTGKGKMSFSSVETTVVPRLTQSLSKSLPSLHHAMSRPSTISAISQASQRKTGEIQSKSPGKSKRMRMKFERGKPFNNWLQRISATKSSPSGMPPDYSTLPTVAMQPNSSLRIQLHHPPQQFPRCHQLW